MTRVRVHYTQTDHGELLMAILDEHRTDRAAFAVPVPLAAAAAQVVGGGYVLCGWTLQMAGAAGTTTFTDGGAAGVLLGVEALAMTGSITRHLGPDGVEINSGLWIANTAALTAGSVFIRHKRHGAGTDA